MGSVLVILHVADHDFKPLPVPLAIGAEDVIHDHPQEKINFQMFWWFGGLDFQMFWWFAGLDF